MTKWLPSGKSANTRSRHQNTIHNYFQDSQHKRPDKSAVARSSLSDAASQEMAVADPEHLQGRSSEWGTWGRPCGGELVSGDTAVVVQLGSEVACAVVDVLGHGPDAHELAKHIEGFLEKKISTDPIATLYLLHSELRGTRGAVAGVAVFDPVTGKVRFGGCGNVVARRMGSQEVRLNSAEGTLGQSIRTPSEQTVILQKRDVLLMHTDGVKSRFGMNDYPNIYYEHASTIAKTVVDKFSRSYDDATCLALRYKP